ncbi:MAG: DUF86 domain-containing protein [bacterium]
MLQYCRAAQEFAQGYTFETFLHDAKTQAACLHEVLIVGEAASQLPAEFRAAHPTIPWREVIGTRNKLIHGYDGIRWSVVWEMLQRDMPELEPKLVALLETLTTNSD